MQKQSFRVKICDNYLVNETYFDRINSITMPKARRIEKKQI